MSRILRVILVTLICLLTSAGTLSLLHHHAEGDEICFCTDCDGTDDCSHHDDDGHGHADGDSCPYRLDAFKLTADSDLTAEPDIVSLLAYVASDCDTTTDSCATEYGCHRCHFCKSPVITRFGLRSPPYQFSC